MFPAQFNVAVVSEIIPVRLEAFIEATALLDFGNS